MQIKTGQEQAYADWKAKNANGIMEDYGGCVFWFAEHWAEAMEQAIQEGQKLEDVADELSHKVDNSMGQYGLTGFQYGAAVSVLANCWEHGEQLRLWHNLKTQLHDEGEKANESGGVLNPALMTMQPREQ